MNPLAHTQRDHGGGVDAAVAHYGGVRDDWLDLSTGINPIAYPVGELGPNVWAALPDTAAMERLLTAARTFWDVPKGATIIAAPGTSAIIALMPMVAKGDVYIPPPTYNEHAAAFHAFGRRVTDDPAAPIHIYVHPNNPDGRLWDGRCDARLTVIDESFCDTNPKISHVARTVEPGMIVLKSFGKFWGMAGLRLGFAIGRAETLLGPPNTPSLWDMLGPWAVSGPALAIGADALANFAWAAATRARLTETAARLDTFMAHVGAHVVGGTSLFRTYEVPNANVWRDRFVQHKIWTRTFPYSTQWIRLGLPGDETAWQRLQRAIE